MSQFERRGDALIRRAADTYSQRYKCSNCSYEGTVEIEKGVPNSVRHCPVCDCKDYRKKGAW